MEIFEVTEDFDVLNDNITNTTDVAVLKMTASDVKNFSSTIWTTWKNCENIIQEIFTIKNGDLIMILQFHGRVHNLKVTSPFQSYL